jgi:hypothetical protein
MPREVEPSLNEKQFFAKALQENIRLDGRAFDQFRALELEFGDEYGIADVRLGKTRYVISLVFKFLLSLIYNSKEKKSILHERLQEISLTTPQSPHPHHSRSNSPLPRPPLRWHLHHNHRTLPHGLALNGSEPAIRNRDPSLPPPRENHPPFRSLGHRILVPNRRVEMLVYPRRCPCFKL